MSNVVKVLGVTHELSNCELTRVDIDTDHYYFINGEFAVSVTRILDTGAPFPEGLRQWLRNTDGEESLEVMNMAKDRGSKLHDALDRLAQDIELDLAEYPTKYEKEALVTFVRTMRWLQPTMFKTELIVADSKLRVGGTMDFVGVADKRKLDILADSKVSYMLELVGDNFQLRPKYAPLLKGKTKPVKFVMDYKFTGRSSYNHKVQSTKYRAMYNQSYAKDMPAKYSYIWRYSPKHKLRFDMQDASVHLKTKVTEKSFDRIYETAIEYMGGYPEPPEITVFPEKIRLFEPIKKPAAKKEGAKANATATS